ncbi:hypothetical protein [Streptomyces sp. NPDC088246]|uniref:hypothetical protein n=1 Tax=Streptomyces sp. NPDC088246 TaxID=3365842 RepID=UPI00382ECB3D
MTDDNAGSVRARAWPPGRRSPDRLSAWSRATICGPAPGTSPPGPDTEELEATVVREWRRGSVVALEQPVRSPEFAGRVALRLGRILAQDLDELRAEPADHVVRDPYDEAG